MSQQVRLQDHVYERIKPNKRDGESFSEAVERLIGGRSLRDLRGVFDESEVAEMREAIDAADERDRDSLRQLRTALDTTATVRAATERFGPENPDNWGPGVTDNGDDSTDE